MVIDTDIFSDKLMKLKLMKCYTDNLFSTSIRTLRYLDVATKQDIRFSENHLVLFTNPLGMIISRDLS